MRSTDLPRLAVTMGDPAGIGPEQAVRLLAVSENVQKAKVLLIADPELFSTASRQVGVDIPTSNTPSPGRVTIVSDNLRSDEPIPHAQVSRAAGENSLRALRKALSLYMDGAIDAILSLPLNKSSLHLAGMDELDEMRWFANSLHHEGTTSELNYIPELVTSRVTSHVPVKDIARGIAKNDVIAAGQLLNEVLLASGYGAPRLAVCALNPHAGENGRFGREEIDEIAPAIDALRDAGVDASGPFPCDTVFIKGRDGHFDGIVTMYHDQGQIAMKLMGFDEGVTVYGGLPVPITTPAHGTAFDIVGKNRAGMGAAQRAFDLAISLATSDRTQYAIS